MPAGRRITKSLLQRKDDLQKAIRRSGLTTFEVLRELRLSGKIVEMYPCGCWYEAMMVRQKQCDEHSKILNNTKDISTM